MLSLAADQVGGWTLGVVRAIPIDRWEQIPRAHISSRRSEGADEKMIAVKSYKLTITDSSL